MEKRINIFQTEPETYKTLMGIEHYLEATALSHTVKELIKIRASQINGCAYCLNMHTKDALKYGETPQRIYVVSAWRETDLFTEEEQAVLALTEEMTLISQKGVSEETYKNAARLFDEHQLAQIMMAIVAINAWNRIGVATRLHPAKDA
jgi:AhpD family alkylhydroperoxidase